MPVNRFAAADGLSGNALNGGYFFGAKTMGSSRLWRALRTQSPVSKKAMKSMKAIKAMAQAVWK